MDIMKDLQDIFRDVFDDEELVIQKEMSAEDIEDWDSLAQMRLIVAIEKHFRIQIPIEDVAMLENIGDMISLIKRQMS